MIRALREEDAEAYAELRHGALVEAPLCFAASPADDVAASVTAVRETLRSGPDTIILGAFSDELVGAVGLYRDRHVKTSHKVHLWGMYVAPPHRCHGLASSLLAAAVAHARSLSGVTWVHLSVTDAAPGAKRLYERAGFRIWGTEPDSLRHGGRSEVEHHMALHLAEAGAVSVDEIPNGGTR